MKILFWHKGDSSVGIQCDEATLEIESIDYIQKEVTESIRKVLEEAWGFDTYAESFDDLEKRLIKYE